MLGPLRQLSYWTMKKRARSIGESGMHQFVADLMTAAPQARIHLMGHSFGCIVMSSLLGGAKAAKAAAAAGGLGGADPGRGVAVGVRRAGPRTRTGPGYFNPWVRRPAVRGPIVVSRSIHDRAVGRLYPWASAVSLSDGSFGVDDEDLPLYGAIGAFGIRGLGGVVARPMLDDDRRIRIRGGKVYNLESSQFIAKGDGASGRALGHRRSRGGARAVAGRAGLVSGTR